MAVIKGSGKGKLIGCRVNEEYQRKIDTILSGENSPFSSQADFVYTLIIEYFERERVERIQKETILEFIKNDPDVKKAIRDRAIEILSADLAEAKKQ